MSKNDVNEIRWEEDYKLLIDKQHKGRTYINRLARKVIKYLEACFEEIRVYWIKFELTEFYPIGEDDYLKDVIEVSFRTKEPDKVCGVIDLATNELRLAKKYSRYGDVISQGDDWYLILLTKEK